MSRTPGSKNKTKKIVQPTTPKIEQPLKKQLDKIVEVVKDSPVLPSNLDEMQVKLNGVQQKWDQILQFSQKNNLDWLKAWGMAYAKNPYVQNDRLKQIKTVGSKYSRDKIEDMLISPSTNEQGLRASSRYFYNTVPPIMKLYHMYSDVLTYRTYIKLNDLVSNVGDKVKKEYKQVANWLRSLDPKRIFRNITLESMIEGKKFFYIREDLQNNIVSLQEMPSDYCKVVHKFEGGWQYSFNMLYFLRPGVSPAWFPPEFEEYLQEFYSYYNVDDNKLNSEMELPQDVTAYYSNRNWFFWKEIPIGKGWVFGFDDTIPEVVPPLSSMFLDANELSTYKMLEQELLSIPLKQIMTASVPLSKEGKGGNFANDTSITPDLIQLYQDIIQSILPISTSFIAAPFDSFQVHTFESVANRDSIVGDAMQNFYSQGGVSGLLTTSPKPNLSQVKNAQVIEARFIDKVYPQYKYFLNYMVNKMKLTNKWEIFITGDVFSDKDTYTNVEKGLMSGNTDLMVEYMSFYDTDISTKDATMQLINLYGIYDKLKPLVSAYQQGDQSKNNGRPNADLDKIESDATATSIDTGTNKGENRITKFSLDKINNMSDEEKEQFISILEDMDLIEE